MHYQRQTLADAPLAPAVGGWSNVPNSFSPPKQTTFTHAADNITANSPLAPAIQGRITCADGNSAPPACPTITSP